MAGTVPAHAPGADRGARGATAPVMLAAVTELQSIDQRGVNRQIAEELGVREEQIRAAVELLDGGSTVPFIARYRKEVTGSLDDGQLRDLEERLRRYATQRSMLERAEVVG